MTEEWKDIPGYAQYQVSTQGRVRSYKYRDPRIMRAATTSDGYAQYCLRQNGRGVVRLGHHLVLEAFDCPRPDGLQCRHLNGNPQDNRIDNLKWGTPKQNIDDQRRHGTMALGEKRNAKVTAADVVEMFRLHAKGATSVAIGKAYGLSASYVSKVLRGQKWKHIGLTVSTPVST